MYVILLLLLLLLNVQIACETPMKVKTPKLPITNSSLLTNNVYAEYENKLK